MTQNQQPPNPTTAGKIRLIEEDFPHLNRLKDGYVLVGIAGTMRNPVGIYRYTWPEKSRYSGAKLRELRAERGVGGGQAKRRKLQARMKALDELAGLSQELGLYNTTENPLVKKDVDNPSQV